VEKHAVSMRRLVPWILVLAVLGAFAWTLLFLYRKSQAKPVTWQTTQAEVRDVIQKTVATGAIVPRKEVLIKPQVSGVLYKLNALPGQLVKAGSLLGEIKIIPNVVSVGSAEARVDSAKISLDNAEREHQRLRGLFGEQLISQGEFNKAALDLALAQQELTAARNNLSLVKDGAIKGSRKVSNQITSTVEGMIIEVPVKEGATVIEANTFNEGTTIAAVADMRDLIFQGKVDESEVGKLNVGMDVSIRIGALENERFTGQLEYLSPKGIEKEGTIEFEVRARVQLSSSAFVRANYSATADIILARRDQVLAVPESVVQFADAQPAEGQASPAVARPRTAKVEIEVTPQVFEARVIELGLSDGLYSEVLSGISATDRLKMPNPGE
jgi:HlyD family secretion protein